MNRLSIHKAVPKWSSGPSKIKVKPSLSKCGSEPHPYNWSTSSLWTNHSEMGIITHKTGYLLHFQGWFIAQPIEVFKVKISWLFSYKFILRQLHGSALSDCHWIYHTLRWDCMAWLPAITVSRNWWNDSEVLGRLRKTWDLGGGKDLGVFFFLMLI